MNYADELERYMLVLVNEERTSRGLSALQMETNLNASAEDHSLWMLATNTFSHTGVGNSSSTERIVAAGFDYVGTRGTSENIAAQSIGGASGYFDEVAALHTALMNSPGHRANILNANRDYIGIGIEIGTFTYDGGLTRESVMITQNFGRTQGSVDLDDLNGSASVAQVVAVADPLAQMSGVVNTGGEGNETLSGTSGNDTLYGGGGADRFIGGDGDDLFVGGNPLALSNVAGGDTFEGGNGIDAVSYAGSFGSLLVDLQFSHVNTFAAAGDTYDSIENLTGSQGSDNLRGSQEDNLISGEKGVDYIFGRRGNDTLEGGVGDDVLFGGVGEDVLSGGEHRDRAQYSESLTAVLLDLADSSRNTGEAAGDIYLSIEDLAGGRFSDTISGNDGNNRLFGRESADYLEGRAGDDYLNGGSGEDTLIGGIGNDTLRGGVSRDTFVFDSGSDVIEDWNLDQINLDRTLWGGADLTASSILGTFGSIENGNAVFDFDAGNTLTLEGLTNLAPLEAFIFDF